MTVLLHLIPVEAWEALPPDATTYAPPSLETEGFVHCTAGDDLVLQVADAFYRDLDLLALSLDSDRLRSPIRWEAPSPAPPADAGETVRFPHVYGPLDLDAVVAVRRVERTADGPTRLVPYDANC